MTTLKSRPLRILTWHVHGAYLYYLSHIEHEIYLPVREGRPEGYGGRAGWLAWPDNLHEVPAEEVRNFDFDCILYQSARNYLLDGPEILSEAQLRLPRIFLEHDPPCEHPTNTPHVVDDPDVLLVHVTHFNRLMWDARRTPSMVIEHGVTVPDDIACSGELPRGIAVVNNLERRGRRLGLDVYREAALKLPLDLAGMGSESLGGLGEVKGRALFELESRYRFFFNPIRYTSLGLAVCEAMMLGLPVVGLATTEMATVIESGRNGFVDTSVERLVETMQGLVKDRGLAARLGEGARATARERFGLKRFVRDWHDALARVTGGGGPASGGHVREASA